MMLATFALTYTGMSSLSLAMNRHAREALEREVSQLQTVALQTIGSLALIAALLVAARDTGWPLGTVTWLGLTIVSAMLVVLLHTYRARSMVYLSFWIVVGAGVLALPA